MKAFVLNNNGEEKKVIGRIKIVNKEHPFSNVTVGQFYHVVGQWSGEVASGFTILDNDLRECMYSEIPRYRGIKKENKFRPDTPTPENMR